MESTASDVANAKGPDKMDDCHLFYEDGVSIFLFIVQYECSLQCTIF